MIGEINSFLDIEAVMNIEKYNSTNIYFVNIFIL